MNVTYMNHEDVGHVFNALGMSQLSRETENKNTGRGPSEGEIEKAKELLRSEDYDIDD